MKKKTMHERYVRQARALPPVEKKYYVRFYIALVIYVTVTVTASMGRGDTSTTLFQLLGGGMFAGYGNPPSIQAAFVTCAPMLIFCYLFSDYLREGLNTAAASVFTRTNKRVFWAMFRVIQLSIFVCAYVGIGAILIASILFIVNGDGAILAQNSAAIMNMLMHAALLTVLMLVLLLILINLIAVRFSVVGCYVAVMGIYVSCLLLCSSFTHETASLFVHVLPSSQSVLAWHDVDFMHLISTSESIEGFSLPYSYTYLLVSVGLGLGASALFIKDFDFI